jgi:hypothetical protein
MPATTLKHLHPNERLTAITGMIRAKRASAEVGMRPKDSHAAEPAWINTERLATAGDMVDTGMILAGRQWPDQDEWDLVGCDDRSDWGNAACYASFGSFDDGSFPGWDPTNGNDGAAPDGFSS